ncbi:hypothetical protein C8F04DRAFT_1274836 [Mycena alexandri]|uniref:Uncharacterized protein n=1 Tax=Mycena alexandri TaxID=1745969 RepID=A0AAD6WTQ2_9AGAR|nr:hypothetical protein C8F04DRAFT_1274836 [Mycena alexandri]
MPIAFAPGVDSLYPLAMVETHAARARQLRIHFYASELADAGPQIELFQCLAKHASRWQELKLRLTSRLSPVLTDLQGRVPSLRSFSINRDRLESQTTSIDTFRSSPSPVYANIYNKFRPVSGFAATGATYIL